MIGFVKGFIDWWGEIFTGLVTTAKGMRVTGKLLLNHGKRGDKEGNNFTGRHFYHGTLNERILMYPPETEEDKKLYESLFPDRFRGDLFNDVDLCIGCFNCQKICPVDCFWIEIEPTVTNKKRISRFDIDLGRCIYCHLCVEACPEDKTEKRTSLIMTHDFEYSTYEYIDQVRSFGEGFYTKGELQAVLSEKERVKQEKAAERKREAEAKKAAAAKAEKPADEPKV
ncbi:MAG: 4Fe-4S dicluster domain-containing protein [Planctomycetes bacterium]|nr:4Fe-4S dicluster domain-containing protein [Planctomycetota bacterium]